MNTNKQDLDDFQTSLHPCALDEDGLSFMIVNITFPVVVFQ